LETNAKSPISPITKENYKKVAHFVQNKMKLYAVASTSPDSIESFAAEIALQLDTLNDFEKRYKQELEDEEDFLDANDVPDIEQRIRLNHTRTEELKTTMNEVSLAATTIFSEERLYGLVKKLSSAKEDSLLESFSSIAVLISRLKNTIGISTAAFLALSSPLVPLWPTLYQRYSVALPVPQIDSAASLFSLYCQSYAFFLSTQISDNDFFIKQKPLSLAHNRQMVDFFKRIVAARTLHHFQSPLTTEFISFMKSFNLLLLQLQSRNHARTWAKIDELLLPELRAVNLANPANSTHLIAQYCPMLIPMLEKVKLFNSWVTQDRFTHQGEQDGWAPNALQVNIRRGPMLLTDAFSKLMPLHARLKEKLKVQFLSEDGTPEPGIDGGGLFRELFTEVVKLAFSPDFGLFSSTAEHSLYPNPHSAVLVDESIRKFQFLGQLLGKCIYESLLVDLPFAYFFLNILQGQTNTMRDLASYDSVLFASMQHLLDMSNIEDLGLTFEFGEIGPDGQNRVIELTEKGSMKAVTTKNAPIYVHMIAERRLNQAIKAQSQAFMRGLSDVIQLKWLRLFTPPELSLAICGGGRLDVEDLRSNVEFAGGFHPEHPTVLHLWDVLEELTSEDQQAFLRFVTSVSRPPLLGFGALHPRLCLRLNKTETSFLPTANTCLNLLKLPPYATKTQLKEKLLYAINSGARFELS
jgi:ubiquitin-protein ligase E3 C